MLSADTPYARLRIDISQFEQLLINLIKNVYEAGSAPQDIQLLLEREVSQQGSGLGLALCREIVEANSGQLNLHNRIGGGLSVNIRLTLE